MPRKHRSISQAGPRRSQFSAALTLKQGPTAIFSLSSSTHCVTAAEKVWKEKRRVGEKGLKVKKERKKMQTRRARVRKKRRKIINTTDSRNWGACFEFAMPALHAFRRSWFLFSYHHYFCPSAPQPPARFCTDERVESGTVHICISRVTVSISCVGDEELYGSSVQVPLPCSRRFKFPRNFLFEVISGRCLLIGGFTSKIVFYVACQTNRRVFVLFYSCFVHYVYFHFVLIQQRSGLPPSSTCVFPRLDSIS